jgi:hypothetical protein
MSVNPKATILCRVFGHWWKWTACTGFMLVGYCRWCRARRYKRMHVPDPPPPPPPNETFQKGG